MASSLSRAARIGRVERAIGAYLQAHPQAADSERGIGEWWLRGTGAEADEDLVRDAIRRLVASGRLVAITLPDGQRAYTLGRGDPPRDPS